MTMKLYSIAVAIALGATLFLVNACILGAGSGRAVPANIVHFK
jgi:hypothetical protein